MKQTLLILLVFLAISGCKKEIHNQCYPSYGRGRIIGYDPCAPYVVSNKIYGSGFVIELNNTTSKDTVVTYQIPEGLFDFRPEYVDGSNSSFLFRPEIQNLFKINFRYRIAAESGRTFISCNALINVADFYAAVRDREIFISCITKK